MVSTFNYDTVEKAAKILRVAHRTRPDLLAVMATPPVRSEGALNAASTLNGAVKDAARYLPNDTKAMDPYPFKYTFSGGLWNALGVSQNPPSKIGSYGQGVRFVTDAIAFDFQTVRNPFIKYIIYVTDMYTGVRVRVAANDLQTTATDFGTQYEKWTFASRGLRLVEIYTSGGAGAIGGINVSNDAEIWAAGRDEPNVGIIGDSWMADTISGGDAAKKIRNMFPDWFTQALGIDNYYKMAMNGTGYLNSNGEANNHLQRGQAGDYDVSAVGALDLLFLYTGVNDHPNRNAAFTDAALRPNVVATVSLLMNRQPSALIAVAGPQWATGFPSTQARYDMFASAVAEASGGDPRVVYLDNSPNGENWINANNIGQLLGPDALHPADGRQIARRAVDSLLRKLGSLAG